MRVEILNGTVSFIDEDEESKVLNKIFNSFLIKEDAKMTRDWLVKGEGNYDAFLDFLSEMIVISMIINQGQKMTFKEGVIKNVDFIKRVNETSDQIIKLGLIVIYSLKNAFKPNDYVKRKDADEMFDSVINLLNKRITYDFRFDKKTKLPFKVK